MPFESKARFQMVGQVMWQVRHLKLDAKKFAFHLLPVLGHSICICSLYVFLSKEFLSIFINFYKKSYKFLPSEFHTLYRFPNFWEFQEHLLTFVVTPSRRQSIWRVDVEANERQCRVDEAFSCRHLCEAGKKRQKMIKNWSDIRGEIHMGQHSATVRIWITTSE